MGLFGQKNGSTSGLPQEILDSVNTMQDDLDVLAGKKEPKKIIASTPNRPGIFNDNPAKKMTPVSQNGLTSPVVVTSVDRSNARPDPKDSSPFLQVSEESKPGEGVVFPEKEEHEEDMEPKVSIPVPEKPFSNIPPRSAANFGLPPQTLPTLPTGGVSNGFVNATDLPLGGEPVFQEESPKKKSKTAFYAGVILLVIAFAGAGVFAYFFYFAKEKPSTEEENAQTTPGQMTEVAPVEEIRDTVPFSLSSPNYLSIDIETVTPESFRALLAEKVTLINQSSLVTPVEFLITDKNNNPVAFARFASIMKISLAQAVSDQIDESFSLYLFVDAGAPRVGLSIAVKNRDLMKKAVEKNESEIPFSLQSIYLNQSPEAKISTGKFASSMYKEYTVRYFNISGGNGLSLDYTFGGKRWILGTSKDTLRNIVDTFGASF